MPSSRDILWRLIAERAALGADTDALDERIKELFEETWVVVFTDLVGFSKRTEEFGILHFLSLIHQKGLLLRGVIEKQGGRVLKEEADSWLMLFRHPAAALDAMLECHRICARHNRDLPEEDRVELCVGIGYGPVLRIGDEDVWGREVNVASRLGEDVAQGGETLVSDAFRQAIVADRSELALEQVEALRFPESCWRVL